MRAHSLRRGLWLLNAALTLGVLGAAAWYVLKVRPAAADPEYRQPAWAQQVVVRARAVAAARTDDLVLPVEEAELDVIDDPSFKQGSGRWWWKYSGDPPPLPPSAQPERAAAPQEEEITKIGRVRFVLYFPARAGEETAADSILFWEFRSQKTGIFSPGEFIREPGGRAPPRFLLIDIRRAHPTLPLFQIVYDVYDDPEGEPQQRRTYDWDGSPQLDDRLRERVRLPAPAPAAGAAEGEAGPTPVPPGESAGRTEAAAPGSAAEEEVLPEPTEEDIQPTVIEESDRSFRVEFDDRTVEYFSRAGADAVARSVQTQVVEVDGQVRGLRITGLAANSAAEKFRIQRGDVLVSIDGRPVRSREEAIEIVRAMDPNTTQVTVVLERNGVPITYHIDPRDPRTRRQAAYLDR